MLLSEKWLRQYVDCPAPLSEIIEKLVKAGVPVESVRPLGRDITQVVVAELLEVQKHPQADRLSVTKVSTGSETLQVVCGAKKSPPVKKYPSPRSGRSSPEISPSRRRKFAT